jgi:hypothetical protein
MPGIDVGPQFLVAAAQALDEGVPHADHLCRTEPLEAAHGSQPGLQFAVISFDNITRPRYLI